MDNEMRKLYSCFICTNLLDEATALRKCRHILCGKCIHDWRCCPICYAGPDLLMSLSHEEPLLLSRERENIPSADDENVKADSDVDWYTEESETSDDDDDDTDSDMEVDEQVGLEESVPVETREEEHVMDNANPPLGVQKIEDALLDYHRIVDKDEEERVNLENAERLLALSVEKGRRKRPMEDAFPLLSCLPPSKRLAPEAKEQVGDEHIPGNPGYGEGRTGWFKTTKPSG
ncbi:E3 ubiquitin-protein ligase RNF135-like [Capsella rubella]|uniref:E3 ubiquitin-protein ligase RNF135-like n=1 Tax=Capsella rubella TaxID=81985 RepID=UPI000CD538B3|nr:E3 ubiquitin-protein ligase RNF135-like [Capsella rubella]